MIILEARNLTKRFGPPVGGFTAVDNISFSLQEGEILGLLGPNGAGKTTTLQMLLGLATATSGSIKYFGKELWENRSEILEQVNFSSAYTRLPWLLTVRENLNFISYLYKIPNRRERINRIKEIFQLNEIWNKEIMHLSAGQMTRLNIAKSFINSPKILLLDEPTASLDPEVASFIRDFLANERKQFQVSIIITSHNMSEVEELCDRVVFINRGKIIADDTPENLARTVEISRVTLFADEGHIQALENYCKKKKLVFAKDTARHITVDIKDKEIPKFLRGIMQLKIEYDDISIERPSLEDYFLLKAKDKK